MLVRRVRPAYTPYTFFNHSWNTVCYSKISVVLLQILQSWKYGLDTVWSDQTKVWSVYLPAQLDILGNACDACLTLIQDSGLMFV